MRGRGNTAPEGPSNAGLEPARAPGRISPGGIIVGRIWTRGPSPKGEARVAYGPAVRASADAATDAVDREEIPREYRDTVRDYFRELLPAEEGER